MKFLKPFFFKPTVIAAILSLAFCLGLSSPVSAQGADVNEKWGKNSRGKMDVIPFPGGRAGDRDAKGERRWKRA